MSLLTATPEEVRAWFLELKETAKKDLSTAHIMQHTMTPAMAVELAGIDDKRVGLHSTVKALDTVEFKDGFLNGKKMWVSNIPEHHFVALHVKDGDRYSIVYAERDGSYDVEWTHTVGMQPALNGHMIFNNTPAKRLFFKSDPKTFLLEKYHNFGFITNHYGLALGVYEDIVAYCTKRNMNVDFQKRLLELNFSVADVLWENNFSYLSVPERSDRFWHYQNTLYAFVKKTLSDVVKFVIDTSGSGLYEIGSPQHQRFTDALIYCSHQRSLYFSVNECLLTHKGEPSTEHFNDK